MARKRTASLFGGILMALAAIGFIAYWVSYNQDLVVDDIFSLSDQDILMTSGIVLIAISLLVPRGKLLSIIGFSFSALPSILTLSRHLLSALWGIHDNYHYSYYIQAIAWAFALLIVIIVTTDKLPKVKKLANL